MGWDRVGDVWRWILLGVDGAAAAATTACESERGTERAGERKRTSPWAAGRLRSTGAEAARCRQSRVTESQARPGGVGEMQPPPPPLGIGRRTSESKQGESKWEETRDKMRGTNGAVPYSVGLAMSSTKSAVSTSCWFVVDAVEFCPLCLALRCAADGRGAGAAQVVSAW